MARSTTRVRSGLVGLLFVLACLSITVGTVAVWAHQTLLVTDRFVAVTSRVAAEPQVQALAADKIASQVVTAVDVQGRIAGVLPPNQAFLAIPLTNAVEGVLDKKLTEFFANPRAQSAFVAALQFSHAHLVTLLRNDSNFVDVNGTTATIDLLPIAVEGLRVLQEEGILPASITLPDVTDPAGRDATIATLESRLGRDLPDDFALVQIADANRLATAQAVVRAFDFITILLVVLAVVFVAATIFLSGRRLRMVALLAIGTVVSLLLARLIIRAALNGLVSSLATGDGTTARDVISDLVSDLADWSWILIIVGLTVAVVAIVATRPAWVRSGAAAAGSPSSPDDGVGAWVRAHQPGLAWAVGVLLTTFIVWVAFSPDLAILVAIGLTVVALVVGRRGAEPTAGEPPAAGPSDVPPPATGPPSTEPPAASPPSPAAPTA
jgi:hypothetical protein